MNLSDFIKNALREDIGNGDHSSLASIPENSAGKAKIYAKEQGVAAGIELASQIFTEVDPGLILQKAVNDGTPVKEGDTLLTVEGKIHSMLKAERLVLNCMQRMSGIATLTDKMVQRLEGLPTKILDTRKTTPGFRYLEKWAVRIGGGANHRFGLYDMIMLKDNHIDFSGGIRPAIYNTLAYLKKHNLKLQICIEARSLKEVSEIMACGGVDRIMLDNFTPERLKEAVQVIGGQFQTEATGGVTLETIRAFAEAGVDFISVGALTHSARSLDISMVAVA